VQYILTPAVSDLDRMSLFSDLVLKEHWGFGIVEVVVNSYQLVEIEKYPPLNVLWPKTLFVRHSTVSFFLAGDNKVLQFNLRIDLLFVLRYRRSDQSTSNILLSVVSCFLVNRFLVSWWANFIFNVLSLSELHSSICVINLSLDQLKTSVTKY
jgi:hypothetical protein